jgi:hypothetical protein
VKLAHRVFKAKQVPLGHKVFRVFKVFRAKQVTPARKAHKASKVKLALLAQPELMDLDGQVVAITHQQAWLHSHLMTAWVLLLAILEEQMAKAQAICCQQITYLT